MTGSIVDGELRPLGHRQITSLSAARWADQGSAQSLATVTGVLVRYVTDKQSGLGSLSYTASGTLLAYKAPGDSSYGTGVNVGGSGDFTLTSSGPSGKQMFVTVTAGSLPGGNASEDIEVGIPTGARSVLISPFTQSVRLRGDMVAPTAAIGALVAASSLLTYTGDVRRLRFFEAVAGCVLDLEFFG